MTHKLLVLCCLLAACERSTPSPAPSPAKPAAKPAPKPALTSWPGIAELQGDLRGENGHTVKAGEPLSSEQKLTLAANGSALVQLDPQHHLELAGPASIYLFAEGTVALIEGGARLAVGIQAPADAPLRLVTVHATLNLAPGGEAWVQVAPTLGSYVGVLGGTARVSAGDEGADGGPRMLALAAGTSAFVTRELPETPRQEATTLADAQTDAREQLEAAKPLEPPLDDGTADLEATLSAMTAARKAGQKKAERQRNAKHAGKEALADKLREELVEEARQLHRIQELAIVRFERFRVRTLYMRDVTGPRRFAPFEAVSDYLFPPKARAGGP